MALPPPLELVLLPLVLFGWCCLPPSPRGGAAVLPFSYLEFNFETSLILIESNYSKLNKVSYREVAAALAFLGVCAASPRSFGWCCFLHLLVLLCGAACPQFHGVVLPFSLCSNSR